MDKWKQAQEWETKWHDTCVNSLNEEIKQLTYAQRMGLPFTPSTRTPYNILLNGESIIDIGGGPYSLLLKCSGFSYAKVVDPFKLPSWVFYRYHAAGIGVSCQKGEDFHETGYDEVWIYNCLQHCEDPEKVIKNALAACKLVRLFEWIDIPPTVGHINTLTEQKLNTWLKGEGKVTILDTKELKGKAYYGVFIGETI